MSYSVGEAVVIKDGNYEGVIEHTHKGRRQIRYVVRLNEPFKDEDDELVDAMDVCADELRYPVP